MLAVSQRPADCAEPIRRRRHLCAVTHASISPWRGTSLKRETSVFAAFASSLALPPSSREQDHDMPGSRGHRGARGSVNFLSATLAPFYGSTTPTGFVVYVRLAPQRMSSSHDMSR